MPPLRISMRLGTSFSAKAPVLSTTRWSSGMKGRRTAWLPAAMMAFLKAMVFFGAGLVLRGASGFFNLDMVGADKRAVAAHHSDLAHLGHGGQPTGQFANDLLPGRWQHVTGRANLQPLSPCCFCYSVYPLKIKG